MLGTGVWQQWGGGGGGGEWCLELECDSSEEEDGGGVMLGTGVWQQWGGGWGVEWCLELECDSSEEDEGWVMLGTGVRQQWGGGGGEWYLELECDSSEEEEEGVSDTWNWSVTAVRRTRGWVMLGTGVWRQWGGGGGGEWCLELECDSSEEDEGVSDARNWSATAVKRRMRGGVMHGTGVWQQWGGRLGCEGWLND